MTEEERTDYLKIVGRKGLQMLGIIDSLHPVIERINESPYKEILTADIEAHVKLFNKIYGQLLADGKTDPMDVVRLQVRHEHIMKIANDLAKYEAAVDHVNTTRANGTDQKAI